MSAKIIQQRIIYSCLNAFVGFAVAALKDRKLIDSHATINTNAPAIKNRIGLITACNVKFCCHLCIKYHVIGVATMSATTINRTNSRAIKMTTLATDAPNTLRTPISFVLRSTAKDASPSSPRHPMKMESPVKIPTTLLSCWSALYWRSYSASRNL